MAGGGPLTTTPGLTELFAGLNVFIVGAIIYLAGRKGISAGIAQRSKDISKRLVSAREELKRMRTQMSKAKVDIDNIDQEKIQIIKKVEDEGLRLAAKLREEAQGSAARIEGESKLSSDFEFTSYQNKMKSFAVNKAVESAMSKMQSGQDDALKTKVHESLMKKFLSEIPTLKNAGQASSSNKEAHTSGASV